MLDHVGSGTASEPCCRPAAPPAAVRGLLGDARALLPEMMLPRRTDAVTVIAASAEATRQRLGLPRLEPWSFACRASHGKILADGGG